MAGFNQLLIWFLGGACHQIPERCYSVGQTALPLCARCMGTFAGALVALTVLWAGKHPRASNLPPFRIIALLAAFFLLWALDGLNSVLALVPDLPHPYEPQNSLRFISGSLEGLALAVLLLPMFNHIVWAEQDEARSVAHFRWFVLPLLLLGVLAGLTQMGVEPVISATFVAAVVGLMTLLTMANGMLAYVLCRREGQTSHSRDLLLPLMLGLLASIGEVSAMAAGRNWLERFLPLLST